MLAEPEYNYVYDVNKTEYVIFASSYTAGSVVQFLSSERIGFKQLVGSFEGFIEDSFLISTKDFHLVQSFGYVEGEESILLLGRPDGAGSRLASLHFLDSDKFDQVLGPLIQTTKEHAETLGSWSMNPLTVQYWPVI